MKGLLKQLCIVVVAQGPRELQQGLVCRNLIVLNALRFRNQRSVADWDVRSIMDQLFNFVKQRINNFTFQWASFADSMMKDFAETSGVNPRFLDVMPECLVELDVLGRLSHDGRLDGNHFLG